MEGIVKEEEKIHFLVKMLWKAMWWSDYKNIHNFPGDTYPSRYHFHLLLTIQLFNNGRVNQSNTLTYQVSKREGSNC